MSKRSHSFQSQLSDPMMASVFCGVDVSAATLAVAVQQDGQPLEQREFANTSAATRR